MQFIFNIYQYFICIILLNDEFAIYGEPVDSYSLNLEKSEELSKSSTFGFEGSSGDGVLFSLNCYSDNIYRRHPLYPTKYYHCIQTENNEWEILTSTCSYGVVFNEEQGFCETDSNSSYPQPSSTTEGNNKNDSGDYDPFPHPTFLSDGTGIENEDYDPFPQPTFLSDGTGIENEGNISVRTGVSPIISVDTPPEPKIHYEVTGHRSAGGGGVVLRNIYQDEVFGKRCFNFIYNLSGICMKPEHCESYFGYELNPAEIKIHSCSMRRKMSYLCCVQKILSHDFINEYISPNREEKNVQIPSAPKGIMDSCGFRWSPDKKTDLINFYRANDTAESLKRKGFNITSYNGTLDRLHDFTFKNDTYESTYEQYYYEHFDQQYVIAGVPARREVSTYVALLGDRKKGKPEPEFHCDGILINYYWVLTSAHCYERNITIVRLGEVDKSTKPSRTENPEDFGIKTYYKHPAYRNNSEVYHDLALIQLDRRAFEARPDINPLCLPWGEEATVNLTNRKVTLTGFGATSAAPQSKLSDRILEVNVTIFDINECRNYSAPEFTSREEWFPMINEIKEADSILLCAGNKIGEGDACKGDSGGPIVYSKYNEHKREDQYYLAGVVATGLGCGSNEYPGLYVRINNPHYLNWIKQIAFNDT